MNVLLVDDHNIVINGLKVLLKNEILNVNISEADTLESAYEFIEANQYEVAVLDLNLRGKFCFDLIKLIHSRQPQCKIMVYSSYSEEVYSLRVYKLGAKGYINKKEPIKELKYALNTIMNGKIYYSERTKELMLDKLNKPESSQALDALSNRELEVAMLLLNGKSLKEIESALFISKSTASTFKRRIFSKLGISNILELSELFTMSGIG